MKRLVLMGIPTLVCVMCKNFVEYSKYISILLIFTVFSCDEQFSEELEKEIEFGEEIEFQKGIEPVNEEDFFYYNDEKIYFQQLTEKIFLKSVPNIHWMEITPLISDSSFTVSVAYWTETTPYFYLIAKDEKPIPLTTLESFESIPEIVSASYLYRFLYPDGTYLDEPYLVIEGALTDEFAVKLKKTVSYTQLQTLAEQNDCKVIGEDPFVKNQIRLSVSKKSELNAIQMSKLFYETGLFDFSSPNFGKKSGQPFPHQVPTPFFYYYYGLKIYLKQATDKILLKFASDASREQILSIIKSGESLQLMSGINYDDLPENYIPHIAVLETKNGNPITSLTIEFFKKKAEVVSVSYLFNNGDVGFTDEITVKLKGTTSYEQLQELAKLNNCIIGNENQFTKNQFMVYVSKTSDLDALQTSNLFYETGLFQYAEPNFYNFNIRLH